MEVWPIKTLHFSNLRFRFTVLFLFPLDDEKNTNKAWILHLNTFKSTLRSWHEFSDPQSVGALLVCFNSPYRPLTSISCHPPPPSPGAVSQRPSESSSWPLTKGFRSSSCSDWSGKACTISSFYAISEDSSRASTVSDSYIPGIS